MGDQLSLYRACQAKPGPMGVYGLSMGHDIMAIFKHDIMGINWKTHVYL